MSSCGSTTGSTELCITQGSTKRVAVLYKRYADGVQVPLDAADYSAELVLRRSVTYPTPMAVLSDGDGLTLSTEDDGIRVHVEFDASVTEDLEVGRDFRYTLRLVLTADPDADSVVILNSTAKVEATAL